MAERVGDRAGRLKAYCKEYPSRNNGREGRVGDPVYEWGEPCLVSAEASVLDKERDDAGKAAS